MLIAHISDLHLNSFYNDCSFTKIKFILKKLSEDKIDHLIITGDLTDNASEKDFIALRYLLKRFDFLSGERLTLITGNHDIYGGIQKAEDIFTFPEKCSSTVYNEKLETFLSYFPEAFNNCQYISPNNFFPFTKILNNTLIIGINSVAKYSRLSNPFGSNGLVDASQFGELYKILKSNNKDVNHKILIIHHHFNKLKSEAKSTFGSIWSGIEKQTMKLKGKKRLFNLFNEFGVDIVLHGHIHESKEYYRKGIRFLNAGAALKNSSNSMNINYLSLTKNSINVQIDKIEYPGRLLNDHKTNYKKEQLKLINAALTL